MQTFNTYNTCRHKYSHTCVTGISDVEFMVLNATLNNILVYILAVSFIAGGNRSTRRKSLTNFIT